MLFRLLALSGLLFAAIGNAPKPTQAANSDGSVVQAAAVRLGRQPVGRVVAWLQHQSAVQRAAPGADGRTLEILFRDGGRSFILSPQLRAPNLAHRKVEARLIPQARLAAPGSARALVLEPFATELNLPPAAGSGEVAILGAAGFRVDGPLTDGAVTPATLATLAQYNVVYMHTHTGVDQNGAGVLATGEPAGCAPYLSADGTIATVGVAGSTQCFHAITAAFVRKQIGQFPANAIIYVNGCDLLDAADFLQAFSDHGVGVTLSWNGDATGFDGYLSSLALFNQLAQGMTVSQALTALYSNHYGTSHYQNHTATLAFKGNGAITLQLAAAGGSPAATPTSTSQPTNTPIPAATSTVIATVPPTTSTPTNIPTSTPTAISVPATPIPAPINTATYTPNPVPVMNSIVAVVKPGANQSVMVQNLSSGSEATLTVKFPNGDRLISQTRADTAGLASFSFAQAASKITRHNETATLTVSGQGAEGAFALHASYQIAFGRIDVSAQPRKAAVGHTVTVWVHTTARTGVTTIVKLPHGKQIRLHGVTGRQGWTAISYHVARTLHHGQKLVVRAQYQAGKRQWHSATSIQVA